MSECGYVPMKLQKEARGQVWPTSCQVWSTSFQIWPTGYSLLTPIVEFRSQKLQTYEDLW